MMLRRTRAAIAILAGLILAAPSGAAPERNAWQGIAAGDSAAALALIEHEHPGAAPELGDRAFQATIARARSHVTERLPKVVDYFGYAALMEGLAADFGDGHIRSSAIIGAQRIDTAGLVLVRQGGHWLVGAQQPLDGEPDLVGWTLTACEGRDADAWALPRVAAFRGDADVEAVRANAAAWLLFDYKNPFLVRPKSCRFAKAGEPPRDLTLRWRPALASTMRAMALDAARPAAAGMVVEPFAGGWWIGLQTLDSSADAVVKAVERNRAALRAAPLVVVDLRGNGGGDSAYADAIARVLLGEKRFAAAQMPVPRCAGGFWRASPGALQAMRDLRQAAAARGDDMAAVDYDAVITDMSVAIAAGRHFSPALPACASRTQPPPRSSVRPLPPAAIAGKLVLVTDRACFSSCLIAANLFRRAGALHVGEATDRSTRYMDVREVILPSGLRAFTTLQKVAVGLPDFGPYSPDMAYPGALADQAALRQWIVATAFERR